MGVHVDDCSNIKIVLNLETFRFLRAPWNTQIGPLHKGNHRRIYKKMQTFQCTLLFIFFFSSSKQEARVCINLLNIVLIEIYGFQASSDSRIQSFEFYFFS